MKHLLLSACLLVGACTMLKAEEQDSVKQLSQLVVTGKTKPKESSLGKLSVAERDLPIVLNSLSGDMLKLRSINKLETALKSVPNVNVRTTYGGFNQISIRGFDHSIMMVDGVRDERSALSNSYPTGDLSSVERIEVLKGPASVLYGYSVVGGVVNVLRHQPSETTNFRVEMRYGSWDYHDLNINGGGRLAEGLSVQLGGFYSGGKQWRNTEDTRRSLYAALAYRLGAHQLLWRTGYRNDFYGTEAGLPKLMPEDMYRTSDDKLFVAKHRMRSGIDRSKRYNNSSDYLSNKAFDTSLKWTWQIAKDWKLVNTVAYSWDDIDYLSTEGMNYRRSTNPIYPYYSKNADGVPTYWDLDNVLHNEHLRFEHVAYTASNQLDLTGNLYTGAVKHNLLLGLNFSKLRRYSYSGYEDGDLWGPGFGAVINAASPLDAGEIESKLSEVDMMRIYSYGIYASDVVKLSSRLKAMLSLRYDRYAYHHASTPVTDGKHGFNRPRVDGYDKTASGAWSYRLGLVYQPIESLSLFASLGSFYIPDKTLRLYPNQEYYGRDGQKITQARGGHFFEPQTGYQYELGIKYEVSNRFSLLVSAFNTLRRGELLRIGSYNVPDPTPNNPEKYKEIRVIAQAGQTRSSGLELELNYKPIKQLQLSAGYGYTRARIEKLEDNAITRQYPFKSGGKISHIPEHTLYSYGEYTLDKGLLSGLALNYTLNYRSRMYYNLGAGLSFEPMTQLDLGATYQLNSAWQVGLQVKNVFNYKGYTSSLGTQLFPNEPTNFVASLTYQL